MELRIDEYRKLFDERGTVGVLSYFSTEYSELYGFLQTAPRPLELGIRRKRAARRMERIVETLREPTWQYLIEHAAHTSLAPHDRFRLYCGAAGVARQKEPREKAILLAYELCEADAVGWLSWFAFGSHMAKFDGTREWVPLPPHPPAFSEYTPVTDIVIDPYLSILAVRALWLQGKAEQAEAEVEIGRRLRWLTYEQLKCLGRAVGIDLGGQVGGAPVAYSMMGAELGLGLAERRQVRIDAQQRLAEDERLASLPRLRVESRERQAKYQRLPPITSDRWTMALEEAKCQTQLDPANNSVALEWFHEAFGAAVSAGDAAQQLAAQLEVVGVLTGVDSGAAAALQQAAIRRIMTDPWWFGKVDLMMHYYDEARRLGNLPIPIERVAADFTAHLRSTGAEPLTKERMYAIECILNRSGWQHTDSVRHRVVKDVILGGDREFPQR